MIIDNRKYCGEKIFNVIIVKGGGGGGGGGFRPIILETLILRYELKGNARTRPEIFMVVLGPSAQFYQFWHHMIRFKKTSNLKYRTSKLDEKWLLVWLLV